MTATDEQTLVAGLQDPNMRRETFSKLITLFQEKIYWQIRKMVISHDDCNDVMQNTFMNAWRSLESFRGDSKLSTWLYRIAINESLNFLNKQRKERMLNNDEPDNWLLDNIEADEYFDGDELQKVLQQAIVTLPEKQRLVFNMRYYDEMKYEDISEILGTSVGALKASYHIAAKKIEEFLNDRF